MIRVILPAQLRILASIDKEVELADASPKTVVDVLLALESLYPELIGTLWDSATQTRRPFVRIFACEQDLSTIPLNGLLPNEVLTGSEPLIFLGAIAGG